MILVLGGEIELYFDDGSKPGSDPFVLPTGYGLVWSPDHEYLDGCSLFIGPIEVTQKRIENIPDEARYWFGSDYEVRRAFVDVPSGKWKSVGAVKEILYYRPGHHADDWKHEFYESVPLLQNRDWYQLRLPDGCRITHRGIERP